MILVLSLSVGREEDLWLGKVLVARVWYIGLDGMGFWLEYNRGMLGKRVAELLTAIEASLVGVFLSELKEFPPPRLL